MAKFTVTKIVDDLDGTESEDAATVTFALEEATYEIDLSAENAQKLRAALAVFIEKARPVTVQHKRGPVTRVPSDAGTIRAWAKSQGIEVSERGRINQSLRDRFAAATA
jgi:uncharacterized protein YabE (DUF348 family)